MPYMFRIPDHRHIELFGDKSVSLSFLMRGISGIWDKSKNVDSLGALYSAQNDVGYLSDENKKRIWKEYIREYKLSELHSICNDADWEVYKRTPKDWLLKSIKEEGIKQPLLIITADNEVGKMIIEGHHRSKAALILGMKTVPGFLIHRTGGSGSTKDLTDEEMEYIERKNESGTAT